jgi:segregation and condensation protein B
MARRTKQTEDRSFDRELVQLPEPLRRREWMMRVEAVIFAAAKPVTREVLEPLVGRACQLDQIIDDIRAELRARPYELAEVAGGFLYRTLPHVADAIRASRTVAVPEFTPSNLERLVLTAVGYFQPVTRQEIADLLGKPVNRDAIAFLRSAGLIATGPRSPQLGAPFTYVTTPAFLLLFGLQSLRDLPDLDRLEEAGLLGKAPLAHELRSALGLVDEAPEDAPEDGGFDDADFWEHPWTDDNKEKGDAT